MQCIKLGIKYFCLFVKNVGCGIGQDYGLHKIQVNKVFRLRVLIISCASILKPSINPIFDFLPLFAGLLLLLSLRVTYIKQSKTRLVLNSNK